jgi:hypothetical protein
MTVQPQDVFTILSPKYIGARGGIADRKHALASGGKSGNRLAVFGGWMCYILGEGAQA